MSEDRKLDLVLEVLAPYRSPTFHDGMSLIIEWRKRCVASLNHEIWDQPVERCLIVRAGCTECEKVLSSLWDGFAEYFELDITVGGMELYLSY